MEMFSLLYYFTKSLNANRSSDPAFSIPSGFFNSKDRPTACFSGLFCFCICPGNEYFAINLESDTGRLLHVGDFNPETAGLKCKRGAALLLEFYCYALVCFLAFRVGV